MEHFFFFARAGSEQPLWNTRAHVQPRTPTISLSPFCLHVRKGSGGELGGAEAHSRAGQAWWRRAAARTAASQQAERRTRTSGPERALLLSRGCGRRRFCLLGRRVTAALTQRATVSAAPPSRLSNPARCALAAFPRRLPIFASRRRLLQPLRPAGREAEAGQGP